MLIKAIAPIFWGDWGGGRPPPLNTPMATIEIRRDVLSQYTQSCLSLISIVRHLTTRCHRPPLSLFSEYLRHFSVALLISAPSPGVYYCQQTTIDSVCLSLCPDVPLFVCHAPSNCFFFLVSRWIRAIFGHHFYMCPSTKRCSSIFDLDPLTPKIYFPKYAQNRL